MAPCTPYPSRDTCPAPADRPSLMYEMEGCISEISCLEDEITRLRGALDTACVPQPETCPPIGPGGPGPHPPCDTQSLAMIGDIRSRLRTCIDRLRGLYSSLRL